MRGAYSETERMRRLYEDVMRATFTDPEQPVHPSMQHDAWDDWKPIRDIA